MALKERRFHEWHEKVSGRWSIEDLRADPRYRDEWISFDCLVWDEDRQLLYIGLTSINNDIFWTLDTASDKFSSLNFPRIADKYDAKLHRSLERDEDGTFIAATAMLHDMDQQREARGGKLVRYLPEQDAYELLDVPVQSMYIQSFTLDRRRRRVYGFTYPAEYMFVHDLATGKSRTVAYLGNSRMVCQAHCAVLDRNGFLWGTWGENRAFEDEPGHCPIRLFRYDPTADSFEWFRHGPSKAGPTDAGNIDHMLLADDGLIYIGGVHGGFSRLDPSTGDVTFLGKPFAGKRLAGLMQASDGHIYGAGNEGTDREGRGTGRIFRYDLSVGAVEDLGPILDLDRDDGAIKIHMMVEGEKGVLYAAENDHLWRSSYLWRCKLGG